jgi:microcin C transport system permease protein
MWQYLGKRFLFAIPTLIGILTINFFIVQIAPGGPVEAMIARIQNESDGYMERATGIREDSVDRMSSAEGIDPALIEEIRVYYGFDKPLFERYVQMMSSYLRFDLGRSFFKDATVVQLVRERMPVSISLGLWSTLIIYLVSIPLGIVKAVRNGSSFDSFSSFVIVAASSIPAFFVAIFLVIVFAGGDGLQVFPVRGLSSPGAAALPFVHRALDYLWHITLPVTAMTIGGFAGLTLLTRNCFLDELGKLYVVSARAKGVGEKRILFGHVFRNAMLIVISGFPAAFVGIFFTGSLMIEIIFSLDGLGLMGYEAALQRDYPVMFGTLYLSTLIGLVLRILSDISYAIIDPRINFNRKGN